MLIRGLISGCANSPFISEAKISSPFALCKKRFYTRPIPCKHEGIISAVPNRKGKYTVQIVNAPRTVLHIQKQYYLCVTSGFKFISQRFQAECKLAGVVDLSVKYYYVLCAIARFIIGWAPPEMSLMESRVWLNPTFLLRHSPVWSFPLYANDCLIFLIYQYGF